jgi:hypothetical protein
MTPARSRPLSWERRCNGSSAAKEASRDCTLLLIISMLTTIPLIPAACFMREQEAVSVPSTGSMDAGRRSRWEAELMATSAMVLALVEILNMAGRLSPCPVSRLRSAT